MINDICEERARLRTLLISNYVEFEEVVADEPSNKTTPARSWRIQLEDYLRQKFGDRYEPPSH